MMPDLIPDAKSMLSVTRASAPKRLENDIRFIVSRIKDCAGSGGSCVQIKEDEVQSTLESLVPHFEGAGYSVSLAPWFNEFMRIRW